MEGLFASGSPLWLILGIACFVFGGYGYYKSRKGTRRSSARYPKNLKSASLI